MPKPTLESVLTSPCLPSLPMVALRVVELTQSASVNMAQLADVIQNDQALTAKVLRTVNSSYYALRTPCTSIRQALNYLGLSAVKSLALGFSLVETLHDPDDVTFDFQDYWRRGICSAVAARDIAEHVGMECPEEAFLGAIMQDLGMVAMYHTLSDTYLQVIDLAEGDHRRLPEIEKRTLDFTHTQVGHAIASGWKLPVQLLLVIQHHHQADLAPESQRDLVRAVELGGDAAAVLTVRESAQAVQTFAAHAQQWFGLDCSISRELLGSITTSARETAALLQVQTGPMPDINNLLSDAQKAA